jgi:glutamate-1-semialdehyde 2,1-aminomutase
MESAGDQIAAIIIEPVAANMGVVLPQEGYLAALRQICTEYGSLLIFDEVITGFRLAPGGAQERFGVMPDLTCLGKIIGGGLPVGAYGGKRNIMERVAPRGDVYQAGTLSGNPLAMSAGLTVLNLLGKGGIYEQVEKSNAYLCAGLKEAASSAGVPVTLNSVASLGCGFFAEGPVFDLESAAKSNTKAYGIFFREMLKRGVYLAPSQFEAFFVGTAHGKEDLNHTIQAAFDALKVVRNELKV